MEKSTSITRYLREIGSRGGKARAEKLTPERRMEIAQLGGQARRKAAQAKASREAERQKVILSTGKLI